MKPWSVILLLLFCLTEISNQKTVTQMSFFIIYGSWHAQSPSLSRKEQLKHDKPQSTEESQSYRFKAALQNPDFLSKNKATWKNMKLQICCLLIVRTYQKVHKSTDAHFKCSTVILQNVGAFWKHTHRHTHWTHGAGWGRGWRGVWRYQVENDVHWWNHWASRRSFTRVCWVLIRASRVSVLFHYNMMNNRENKVSMFLKWRQRRSNSARVSLGSYAALKKLQWKHQIWESKCSEFTQGMKDPKAQRERLVCVRKRQREPEPMRRVLCRRDSFGQQNSVGQLMRKFIHGFKGIQELSQWVMVTHQPRPITDKDPQTNHYHPLSPD